LTTDAKKIKKMTVKQLEDQIAIHRKILQDEVLLQVRLKDLRYWPIKESAVLAAVQRNEE